MNAFLRNLAGIWADNRFIKANDTLRRKLIAAEAANDRVKQERIRLRNTIRSFGQLCAAYQQRLAQAETERDAAQARVLVLEEALVAHSPAQGVLGQAWADAAGVAGPEATP